MRRLPPDLLKKPFTLSHALKQGVTRYQLAGLVKEGVIELVARGVYRATQADYSEEDQYRVATLKVGQPSAICLLSALAHYGLTDAIPKKTWIMVPEAKRSRYEGLKAVRARDPRWQVGVEERDGYAMTTLERTVVDAICARTRVGTQIAAESLRRAVQSKKTTLGKIMDMANRLGVAHRVRPYIEALS